MGRTNKSKEAARSERLKALPRSERLLKSAIIKKKEGRVLDASEKHALKMTSEYGEILRLWEVLRHTEAPARTDDVSTGGSVASRKASHYEHKYDTIDKLLAIISPKFEAMAKTPRVSRVIQSMVKYGSPEHLQKIVRLMEKKFSELADDAFAGFIVTALIRHAPRKVFDLILALMLPCIPQLVAHKYGIRVVHAAYSSRLCSSSNKDLILLSIFKDSMSVMKTWAGFPAVEDILQQEKRHQKRLLAYVFELCDKLVSQKEVVEFPLVQRLVYAFVLSGGKHEVTEMCSTLKPHLASMCTTREGSLLATTAFAVLEPRNRKEVLRGMSTGIGELAVSKHSAPVVARLFDLVYDPQLLQKFVVKPLVNDLAAVVASPFGYLVLMHLLTPREEAKYRFLLPTWRDYNLFSLENTTWNQHTWLDTNMELETVEICPKNAMVTHLAVLPTLVRAFLQVAPTMLAATMAGGAVAASKATRYYVGVIAREVRSVIDAEPMYKQALALTRGELDALESLNPPREKRAREGDVAASTLKKKKRSVEGAVPSACVTAPSGPASVPKAATTVPPRRKVSLSSKAVKLS